MPAAMLDTPPGSLAFTLQRSEVIGMMWLTNRIENDLWLDMGIGTMTIMGDIRKRSF